jgi:CRP-like cAMP-binding protein
MPDRPQQIGSLERLHWLKASTSFRDLPPADLTVLAHNAVERLTQRGRRIFTAGEPVPGVMLLVEGTIHARRGRSTHQVLPGQAIGLLELCAGDEQGLEAVSTTETLSLGFSADVFLDVLEDHFSIYRHILRRVCALRIEQGGDVEWGGRPTVTPGSSNPAMLAVAASEGGGGGQLDLVQRIVHLRRAFPFARGRLSAVAELAQNVAEVALAGNEAAWNEGDAADHLLLLVRGSLSCQVPRDGEIERYAYGPGAVAGTLEALQGTPRWFSAAAGESGAQALRLDVEHLLDVFEDNFETARDYLAWQSRRALATIRETADLALSMHPV